MTVTCGYSARTAATLPSLEALSTRNTSKHKPETVAYTEARQSSSNSLVFQFTITMERSMRSAPTPQHRLRCLYHLFHGELLHAGMFPIAMLFQAGAAGNFRSQDSVTLAEWPGPPGCGRPEQGNNRRARCRGKMHGAGVGGNEYGRPFIQGGQFLQGCPARQTHGLAGHDGADRFDARR